MTDADLNARILVVDDFDVVRREIRLLLRKIGFTNVDTAEDGIEAFAMLRASRDYSLVICDLTMNAMGGLDLLRSVRSDQDLYRLHFIMVTGHSDPLNVVAAKKAGISGYIVKPFNAETLRQRIETVLGPVRTPPPPTSPQPLGVY